jgi:sporulation protein YlmC with PRC-barrel domain
MRGGYSTVVKRPASRLLKIPIQVGQGQKIGRLNDIIVETRTGNMIYLVIDKVDPEVAAEIIQELPSGESIIPISVAKFGDDSVTIDMVKLKLLSLKKNLKRKTILNKARENETGL